MQNKVLKHLVLSESGLFARVVICDATHAPIPRYHVGFTH